MDKIVRLIETKILPLLRHTADVFLVVAREDMRAGDLPFGVTLTPQPVKGKRVVQRNKRIHDRLRLFVADYPDANLQEIAVPKMAYIIGGEVDYLLGQYSLHCAEGSFIFIPPRMPHQAHGPFLSERHLRTGQYDLLQVHALSNGVNIWLSSSRGIRHTANYADSYFIYNQSVADIFTLMTAESKRAAPHWRTLCHGLLMAFFVLVLQEISAGHFTRKAPLNQEEDSNFSERDFVDQARAYIEANCHQPLTLADVASHFFMSVSQFTRRLRQENAPTFVEMLMAARIEQAKRFLTETHLTFSAIASYCSFRSDCYFRTQFIRRVGCTPSEFRQRTAPNTSSPKATKKRPNKDAC